MCVRERRGSARRSIRLACEVRFPSGVSIAGTTRNISSDGVEVEANSVSGGNDKTPTPGELGLLTLKFRKAGAPESILVQCQVVHILGNGLGLTARFSELSRREQSMIGQLVDTGTVQDIPENR
jgi:hypothetical protein